MESITPFIAGINQTFEEDFFEKRGFTLSDLIVVVDIDHNNLVLINSSEETQVSEFPYRDIRKPVWLLGPCSTFDSPAWHFVLYVPSHGLCD